MVIRSLAWFFISLAGLMLLLQLLVLLPPVQNKLREAAVTAIEDNLDAKASIGYFRLGFPKKLKVGEILILGQEGDTLVFVGRFSINVAILPLVNKKVVVQNLDLENVKGDIGKVIGLLSSPGDAEEPQPRKSTPSIPDEAGNPWTFGIRQLGLVSLDLEYRDEIAGIDLGMKVGQIGIGLGDIDLDTLIHVRSLFLAGTEVSLELLETPPVPEEPDTGDFSFANITVGEIELDEVGFTLIDSTGEMLLFTHAGKLTSVNNFVDITHAIIGVDEVYLGDSWCDIVFLPPAEAVSEADTSLTEEDLNWGQYLWRITGNQLSMENCRYTMEYLGEPEVRDHFDPLHMHILEASGEISGFILDADTLVAKISNLRAKEKNGIELLRFDATIEQPDTMLAIRNLTIATPNTELSLDLRTTANPTNYTSLEGEMFDLSLDVRGKNWKDADYFYPFLSDLDILTNSFGSGEFAINTGISGNLDNLDIRQLRVQFLDSTILSLGGNIQGGTDPGTLKMNLNIDELMTCRSELEMNFNLGTSDSTFRMPDWFLVTGRLTGSPDDVTFAGNIRSSNGSIVIPKAGASLGDVPRYVLSMSADLHDLGSLVQSDVDRAVFHLDADIRGDDPATMAGQLALGIDSIGFRQFMYTGIDFKGGIDQGRFTSSLESGMPECLITLKAGGMIGEDDFEADLTVNVETLDLHGLNLNREEFIIRGNTDFSVGIHPDDAYNLSLNLHELDFTYKDSLYRMHPVDMLFSSSPARTEFSLKSFYYQLVFNADASIEEVAEAFIHLPGYYLSDPGVDTIPFAVPEFRVSGSLEYPQEFVSLFFPGIPEFKEFTIAGGYSGTTDNLILELFLPEMRSGSLHADSLYLNISGSSDELDVATGTNLSVEGLLTGKASMKGSFANSEFKTNIVYEDSYSNDYLNLSAQIDTSFGSVLVHLIPPSLTFSYDPWEVIPGNLVTINAESVAFENFDLTNGNERISISSDADAVPGRVELKLTSFSLGSMEQLLAADTVVSGVANADVIFRDPFGELSVEGSLRIDNLALYDFEAGRLDLKRFALNADSSSFDVGMKGPKQDLNILARWKAVDSVNPLDARVRINSLNLSELNYILEDYISDAKGTLEGDIRITGNTAAPLLNGSLKFTDAGMGVDFLNNYFSLGTESIEVENNVFGFTDFSIRNKRDQAATISGTINLGDFSNAYSDLQVRTDNMEIMNSTRKENDILFGLLKAQADVEVKGNVNDIRLNANITIDESTDITYIFPDELALDNNEGIVIYERFDPGFAPDEDIASSTSFFSLQSLRNVRSTIDIQPGARFNLFFDEGGSNFLDAGLNGTINYSQVQDNTEVSGMFQVEEGTLHYGIPMVAVDEYEIEPGSTISLSNDLYNPYLNIVASSSVRASTEGLMAADPKVMTFKILLYLEGELNDVKLRFDISRETGDALVSARLSQLTDEERNVNALNLLVRGSFMMSLQGDEVGGTTTMDAQVDKFYATHLNHLVSENVTFVDLKFDVQSFKEYNAYGETVMQRNYYYNVGKSFFNERARINYKGSLGVTSDMQAEQVNSHFVQNELEMEVKITKDGVLRGVFFRKNQYEGLLEGEVIETGGGIRLRKDFYSIGDIFTSEKRQEEKRGENSNKQKTNDK